MCTNLYWMDSARGEDKIRFRENPELNEHLPTLALVTSHFPKNGVAAVHVPLPLSFSYLL